METTKRRLSDRIARTYFQKAAGCAVLFAGSALVLATSDSLNTTFWSGLSAGVSAVMAAKNAFAGSCYKNLPKRFSVPEVKAEEGAPNFAYYIGY